MTAGLLIAGIGWTVIGITSSNRTLAAFGTIAGILLIIAAAARWEAGREDELERRREWDRRYNR